MLPVREGCSRCRDRDRSAGGQGQADLGGKGARDRDGNGKGKGHVPIMTAARADRSRSRDRDRSPGGQGQADLGGKGAQDRDGKGKGKGYVDEFLLRRVREVEGNLNTVVMLMTARLERVEEDQDDMRRCWRQRRPLPELIDTGAENRPPRTGNDLLDRLLYRE